MKSYHRMESKIDVNQLFYDNEVETNQMSGCLSLAYRYVKILIQNFSSRWRLLRMKNCWVFFSKFGIFEIIGLLGSIHLADAFYLAHAQGLSELRI